MKKSKIYVANWKMNMHLDFALLFSKECKKLIRENENKEKHIILCPTYPAIYSVAQLLQDTPISIGAQNCSEHEVGAYTGEVSAQSLSEIGASYCIVGHSERRTYFHETNEIIARKVAKLCNATIKPIICIGETANEYKENKTLQVLEHQLEPVLKIINEATQIPDNILIAYEPVWAIGTGKIPDNQTLETIFSWLISHVAQHLQIKTVVHLLYGGSVDATTTQEIGRVKNIDGFLIGNASLDFKKFKNIVSLP